MFLKLNSSGSDMDGLVAFISGMNDSKSMGYDR
jgi:hypothetical protein